jgi:hypothetical protein
MPNKSNYNLLKLTTNLYFIEDSKNPNNSIATLDMGLESSFQGLQNGHLKCSI